MPRANVPPLPPPSCPPSPPKPQQFPESAPPLTLILWLLQLLTKAKQRHPESKEREQVALSRLGAREEELGVYEKIQKACYGWIARTLKCNDRARRVIQYSRSKIFGFSEGTTTVPGLIALHIVQGQGSPTSGLHFLGWRTALKMLFYPGFMSYQEFRLDLVRRGRTILVNNRQLKRSVCRSWCRAVNSVEDCLERDQPGISFVAIFRSGALLPLGPGFLSWTIPRPMETLSSSKWPRRWTYNCKIVGSLTDTSRHSGIGGSDLRGEFFWVWVGQELPLPESNGLGVTECEAC